MLQFITDIKSTVPVGKQILDAIDGGCRWVQVRMPGATDDDYRKVIEEVKPVCLEKEVFLLIANRVDLAKELNVGGVHLDKDTVPCSKARMELGPAAVIGITVNSIADILAVSNLDIDYFAIAPFKSCPICKDVAPLGIDGIRDICFQMQQKNIDIAHVAMGGIQTDDVLALLEAGVNGIAVGSAIARSKDIAAETRKFLDLLPMKE